MALYLKCVPDATPPGDYLAEVPGLTCLSGHRVVISESFDPFEFSSSGFEQGFEAVLLAFVAGISAGLILAVIRKFKS